MGGSDLTDVYAQAQRLQALGHTISGKSQLHIIITYIATYIMLCNIFVTMATNILVGLVPQLSQASCKSPCKIFSWVFFMIGTDRLC